MERLTIDKIIGHCERKTEQYERVFGKERLKTTPLISSVVKEYWEHKQVAEYLKKFKEYEDLEEQDRLIKLPCKYVYFIVDINNPKYATIMKKSIRELEIYEIESIDNVGCKYFSTEEEAEAKLKELRGEADGS